MPSDKVKRVDYRQDQQEETDGDDDVHVLSQNGECHDQSGGHVNRLRSETIDARDKAIIMLVGAGGEHIKVKGVEIVGQHLAQRHNDKDHDGKARCHVEPQRADRDKQNERQRWKNECKVNSRRTAHKKNAIEDGAHQKRAIQNRALHHEI